MPAESGIKQLYASVNLIDAYAIQLPSAATTNTEQLASWITRLMSVRDAIVAGFGLKTVKQLTAGKDQRIGLFKIYSATTNEIILGEDDKHLDFRLSVLCTTRPERTDERCLVLSTVVHCHNRLGRIYILLIAPFHRLIVQSMLRRAACIGWPPLLQP